MEREQLTKRISIDSEVCFGKPCVHGRRIWVSLVLDLLASGMKTDEIVREYDLTQNNRGNGEGWGASACWSI